MAERSLTLVPSVWICFRTGSGGRSSRLPPPQAFAVLRYLVLHADRLVTKAELLQHVWAGGRSRTRCCGVYSRHSRCVSGYGKATPQYLDTVGRLGHLGLRLWAATRLWQAEARPVVGRQGEVEWLRERWLWAREGRRQCAMLSGEAGIGKTTVVDLFVASLPTPDEVGSGGGNVSKPTARGNRICRCWKP